MELVKRGDGASSDANIGDSRSKQTCHQAVSEQSALSTPYSASHSANQLLQTALKHPADILNADDPASNRGPWATLFHLFPSYAGA